MEHKKLRLFASVIVMCILTYPASKVSGKNTYTFTSFTFPRFGDANRLDMIKTLRQIVADASRKTGVTIEYKDFTETDAYIGAFKKNQLDIGLISMEDVYTLRNSGTELEPLLLVSMKKKPGSRVCAYVKKPIANLKSLAGVTVNLWGGGFFYGGYIYTRKLLLDNGIDMPLREFFGPIYRIPFEGSSFQALLMDKVDAVVEYEWNYEIFGKNLPGAKSIKAIACTDEYPVFGVFMRKGLDRTATDKLKAYFKTLNSSSILGELRTIFLAMNLQFIDPDPKTIKRDSGIYALARQKGWMKEADIFVHYMYDIPGGKALMPEKKDYKQCKALCDKNADKEGCMDKCMGE